MCPYLYLPVLPTAVCRCQGAARASFLLDEKKSGDLLDLILIRFEWKRLVCSPSSPVCCTFHSHLTSYCVRVPTVSGCLHMQANGVLFSFRLAKGTSGWRPFCASCLPCWGPQQELAWGGWQQQNSAAWSWCVHGW